MKTKIGREQIMRALLSLFLAFFLWVSATANTNPVKTVRFTNLPVEYINVAEGLVVDNPLEGINVRFSGTSTQISKINRTDIRAVVDLSSITRAGEYTLEVVIEGLPEYVSISDISDKYALVRVGNVINTSSDFVLESSGSLSPGCILLGTYYDDVQVSVVGSDNVTESIAQIKGYYDLSGKNTTFSTEVILAAYDAAGNKIDKVSISPESVEVYVQVGQTRMVPINVILEGEPETGFTVEGITLSSPDILLAAESYLLDEISKADTIPISVSGASQSFDAVLGFDLPEGVSVYSEGDIVAHVTIDKVSTKTIVYNNIQLRNVSGGTTGIITDELDVAITVMANADILDGLDEESIPAFIDLAGLEAGEHELTIQYDIPDGVTIIDTTQKTVNVTVRNE